MTALARGLLVALVLFFIVMFLVVRVLLTILGIVRVLALLRFLILLAVFVLGFALLVLCHRGLQIIDTVLCANVTRKESGKYKLPPTDRWQEGVDERGQTFQLGRKVVSARVCRPAYHPDPWALIPIVPLIFPWLNPIPVRLGSLAC